MIVSTELILIPNHRFPFWPSDGQFGIYNILCRAPYSPYTGHALPLGRHNLYFKHIKMQKKFPCICLKYVKGEPKKNNPNTFLVAVGLIMIVQQCYTTRWKRLDVSFQMIIETFLCDEYFLRYHKKCKAELQLSFGN